MLLLGKTQKKHLGDLPPTVPDLPLHPLMSFTKTAEQINMSFGWVTQVGPKNHVLDKVKIPRGNGQFWGLSSPLQSIVNHRILQV